MAFSKSFPKTVKGKNFPEWVDVYLSEKEEKFIEEQVKQYNIVLMKQSLADARSILMDLLKEDKELDESNVTNIGIALFEKIASHSVHAKERRCKDKFDKSQNE